MMKGHIPGELRRYVEREILPQYENADPAHGMGHMPEQLPAGEIWEVFRRFG